MIGRLAHIGLSLIAVILLHDLSMAVIGHHPATTAGDAAHHTHHERDAPEPEDCDTIRIKNLRLPDFDRASGHDVRSFLVTAPLNDYRPAISDTYLVASVLPPPSACLALFQAFLN